ncbi:MAG TPA: hypothetical protein DEW39_11980 [Brevibacterium sp.]|nr:hypothetical protein [Brevibacterium sp.]
MKSVRYLAAAVEVQISSVSCHLLFLCPSRLGEPVTPPRSSPAIERTLVVVHRKRGPLPAVAERFRQSLLS